MRLHLHTESIRERLLSVHSISVVIRSCNIIIKGSSVGNKLPLFFLLMKEKWDIKLSKNVLNKAVHIMHDCIISIGVILVLGTYTKAMGQTSYCSKKNYCDNLLAFTNSG